MEKIVTYLLMIQKFTNLEILVGPICLTGYVYDFSVDYDSVAVNDIKNIHKYLMKKKLYKIFLTG